MALKITTKENPDQTVTLFFEGRIDEDADLAKIQISPHKKVIMDMEKLESINSCGCRNWIKWARTLNPQVTLEFVNCGKALIDYVNMIKGFIPENGHINSFIVPYYCEACDNVTTKKFNTNTLKGTAGKIPEQVKCEHCKGKKDAEIDVISSTFFKFLEKPSAV